MSIQAVSNINTQNLLSDTPHTKATPEFEKALQIAQVHSYKIQYGRDLKNTEKLVENAYDLYHKGVDTLAQLINIPKHQLKLSTHVRLFDQNHSAMRASGDDNFKLAERLSITANEFALSPNPPQLINTDLVKSAADLVLNISIAQKTVAILKNQINSEEMLNKPLPDMFVKQLFLRANTTKENLEAALNDFKETFNVK